VRLTLDAAGQGLALSSNGRFLASTEDGGAVRVWDVASGKLLQVHREHLKSISRPAFSPDGLRIAWAITRQESVHYVKIWDWNARKEPLVLIGHTARVHAVAFHRTGRFLASAGDDRAVIIWDTISPDGQRLASADAEGTVKVWDTSSLGVGP
jgi:WD40 repeat protein